MKKKNIKKYFMTTRYPSGIYELIVLSCKKNHDKNLKIKTDLKVLKLKKIISLNLFIKYFIFIFKLSIDKKFIFNLKYDDINFSNYLIGFTYKDFRTYVNKFVFIKNILWGLYQALRIIEFSKSKNINQFSAIYIDHGIYLNGLLFELLIKKKIKVYSNHLPRGIFLVSSNKNINKKYCDYLKFNKKSIISKQDKIKNNFILKKLFKRNKLFPWTKSTKFINLKKNDFSDFTHVVYAQSFTDAQCLWGNDGFYNNKDWLIFTIKTLSENKNNKILLKSHPNFYNQKMGDLASWDNLIFKECINIFTKNNFNNLTILNEPFFNGDLLKKLNKKAILISHNSNVLLEGIYFNFKCISSKATFWNVDKLKLTNTWSDENEYKKVLNKSWRQLAFSNNDDFNSLVKDYFQDDYNILGKKYYMNNILSEMKSIKNFNYNLKKLNMKCAKLRDFQKKKINKNFFKQYY